MEGTERKKTGSEEGGEKGKSEEEVGVEVRNCHKEVEKSRIKAW